MGNKTLRRKISLFILIPLILGTVITAVVSWLPIYLQYPDWILKVIDDMENDQGKVLMEVSLHLSALTAGALQIPTNYIMMVGRLIEDYYDNEFTLKASFSGFANYKSAIELIMEGETRPLSNLSMWYLSPDEFTISELNASAKRNLNDSAVFDAFARPVLTNFTTNRINAYYHIFADDGLLYETPAMAMSFLQDNYGDNNCSYNTDHYDPRCRPFYSAVLTSPDHYEATLPDPYIDIRTGEVVQSACKGVWSGGGLMLAACVDFQIDDVKALIGNLTIAEDSYAFALNVDGSVFFHPNATNETEIKSILQLEFPGNEDTTEAQYFKNHTVALFHNASNSFTTYTKQGRTMLIAITPVYVMLSLSHFSVHQLSIGVVMPERELRKRFDVLQSDSTNILVLEVVIFFAVLAVIIFLGWL